MSLPPQLCIGERGRFPRVSGDEPASIRWIVDLEEFSPRERG